ncbi:hypothetical protein AVEN_212674-1 [Araneus ventricosus]|uniref:Uncharacterized protein n=1 Tax=Araneus ventricosus TaxID=182803 RepID=A0A4Y2R5E0_ARAVE|nr:hypothetical protein AVEN_212674-1 [Araneus ventricosus]
MDEGRPASNQVSNTWTVARSASTRQKVIWCFSDGLPQLHFKELVIKSSSRRKVSSPSVRDFVKTALWFSCPSLTRAKLWNVSLNLLQANISITMAISPVSLTGDLFLKPEQAFFHSMVPRGRKVTKVAVGARKPILKRLRTY